MKSNLFKYIFFTIVTILILLAIYLLYKDGKEKIYEIENNKLEINITKELNIGIYKYDTINPILSYNRDIQYIDKLIFNPLLDVSCDFRIENKLAKEFSKINDTSYIVKVRDDVYWHDGEKFTIDDVIFTINNLRKEKINSIYKENVKEIKEIQKIDEYTAKIILNNKVEFFEYMMCVPILASHSYDKDLNSKTSMPVGTGEFKVIKIEKDTIALEKININGDSKIININLILAETVNDLYKAFTNKEIDLMVTDNVNYEDYIGSMGYNVTSHKNREFDYLVLNNQNFILKDKEIRKAINYAIDRNTINYNIYNNKYNICDFPIDYGSYLYSSDEKLEHDINIAKDILTKQGWSLNKNILRKNGVSLKLRLLVNKEDEIRTKVAENIKEQLKEIGIEINLIVVNKYQFDNYIKNKNYDIVLTGNVVSIDPNLETFFSDKNISNFKNEQVYEILNNIKNIDNQEENLTQKYALLEQIYKDENPFISLYFNSLFVLTSKNLKGDLGGNWYNIYYNIDNWYKLE